METRFHIPQRVCTVYRLYRVIQCKARFIRRAREIAFSLQSPVRTVEAADTTINQEHIIMPTAVQNCNRLLLGGKCKTIMRPFSYRRRDVFGQTIISVLCDITYMLLTLCATNRSTTEAKHSNNISENALRALCEKKTIVSIAPYTVNYRKKHYKTHTDRHV